MFTSMTLGVMLSLDSWPSLVEGADLRSKFALLLCLMLSIMAASSSVGVASFASTLVVFGDEVFGVSSTSEGGNHGGRDKVDGLGLEGSDKVRYLFYDMSVHTILDGRCNNSVRI